jgi:membrane associated rhomboid family serine protease
MCPVGIAANQCVRADGAPGTLEVMVIPVHDVNPLRRTPWVTYALIAVNVVVLVLTPGMLPGSLSQRATVCRQEAFDYHYGAIPRELVKDRALRHVVTGRSVLTARGPACVVGPPSYHKSPLLSVLTAMFVHAGWLHLLGNMLFLAVFGNNVEDRFRKLPYLIFYLACGYIAAYGFAIVYPGSVTPLVGASGAIAGVLGAYLALFPRARVWSLVPFLFFIPLRIPAWVVLGLWFVLQWAYSVGGLGGGGGVAYVAHVFGFVAGLLTGLVVRAVQGSDRADAR